MDGVEQYVAQLAEVNRNGFGFLLAYGMTWTVVALVWRRFGPRVGSFAMVFQGMVATPVALGLTALAAPGPAPENAALESLTFYLLFSQMVMIPVVIVLLVRDRYLTAAVVFSIVLAAHFVPYSWLYGTFLYVVLAVLIAAAVTVVVAVESRWGEESERLAGFWITLANGVILLAGGAVALAL